MRDNKLFIFLIYNFFSSFREDKKMFLLLQSLLMLLKYQDLYISFFSLICLKGLKLLTLAEISDLRESIAASIWHTSCLIRVEQRSKSNEANAIEANVVSTIILGVIVRAIKLSNERCTLRDALVKFRSLKAWRILSVRENWKLTSFRVVSGWISTRIFSFGTLENYSYSPHFAQEKRIEKNKKYENIILFRKIEVMI